MGYANRVVTLTFDELSDDPEDRIWVCIRNPKLVPIDEMRSGAGDVATDADGKPADSDAAAKSGYRIFAKLIVGWHVYDATVLPELNAAGEDVGAQVLLPQAPVTVETVAKLPLAILNRLMEELGSVNPPQTPQSQEATGNPS
jgi:hypothetical protein